MSSGPHCAAITVKGMPCKNKPRPGSPYCGVHKNYKGSKGAAKAKAAPKLAKLAGKSGPTDHANTAQRLAAASSREQATATLNAMTIPQLRSFAADRGHKLPRGNKAVLVSALVDQTTGKKTGEKPGGPQRFADMPKGSVDLQQGMSALHLLQSQDISTYALFQDIDRSQGFEAFQAEASRRREAAAVKAEQDRRAAYPGRVAEGQAAVSRIIEKQKQGNLSFDQQAAQLGEVHPNADGSVTVKGAAYRATFTGEQMAVLQVLTDKPQSSAVIARTLGIRDYQVGEILKSWRLERVVSDRPTQSGTSYSLVPLVDRPGEGYPQSQVAALAALRATSHPVITFPGSESTEGNGKILPGERVGSTRNRAPARGWNAGTRVGDVAFASRGGVLTAYTVRQSIQSLTGPDAVVADADGVEHRLADVSDRNTLMASADEIDVARALELGPWASVKAARAELSKLRK